MTSKSTAATLSALLAQSDAEIARLRALWLRASPLLQYLAHNSPEVKTQREATAILLEFHQPPHNTGRGNAHERD